jgi:polyhydroxyalkanoate synthesis regulator phasin
MESLIEEIKQVTEEIGLLKERIKEGFSDIREELGSMIKFSYADLERRFTALEARVKALEKIVLP